MQQQDNIIGTTFGIRTITGKTQLENNVGLLYWFKCECGKVGVDTLVGFEKYSCCGCVKQKFRHNGFNSTYIKNVIIRMNANCHNPEHRDYWTYGGRGITVCDRWRGKDRHINFLLDMGERPSPEHSLDRIDNNKGYYPENCRWATRKEQQRNTRTNRIIEYNGVSKNISEWAEFLNMRTKTFSHRIYRGWDLKDAFERPVDHKIPKDV